MQQQVAVVTGGSRGIGMAVARELRKRGCLVAIGDVLDHEGEAFVASLNSEAGHKVAVYKHADVSRYQDNVDLFRAAESEFGGVDIAILNAGIGNTSNTIFSPMEDEREDRIIRVDLLGVIKGTKVALMHMAKRGGVILATASTCSFQTPPPLSAYNAAKHGVVGWIRSLDYMPKVCNVRINAVCPAWIDTDLLTNFGVRGEEPYWEVADALPRATMLTAVEAFTRLIDDPTASGETLLVLPDGVHPYPRPAVFESAVNATTNRALEHYSTAMVEKYKKELQEALDRYHRI